MLKVSLLMLTMNRYELTSKTYLHNLAAARKNLDPNIQVETLICDNGSSDKRIVDFFKNRPEVSYHRINSQNEGVGRSFNQLYLRAWGDFIVLMGNDIEMPEGWLAEGIAYAEKVPNSGIIGWDWGHGGVPPVSRKMGYVAHWLNETQDKVFGAWLMRSIVVKTIGFFHDRFFPYGLEDSDFNNRVNLAGFNSLYVPNMKSTHLGGDVGDGTEYRAMKDKSLGDNLKILSDQIANYDIRGIVEPLPERKDPI